MVTYSSRPNLAPPASSYGPSPSPSPSGSLQPGTKVQVGKYVVKVDKFLSEGGFAHVYVASLVSPTSVEGFAVTQNKFVLKRMAVPDKIGLVEVRKEVDVMKQLRPHKHIVYFIEASASSIPGTSGYEIFILMEFCPGGGIIDLLNSRLQNRLTESEILKIFSDTVDAVAHMHSQKPTLIHRDLKVENILVAAPNLYKLCDFGSTTIPAPRPPQSTAEIQALEADLNKHTTLQYRAPEMVDVWSRRGVTEKADVWALGVFLYKLCYYTTPFEEQGPLAIINVQYACPPLPAYSNSIKYLIGTMLQELAQSRPDIWQVHEHTCKLRGIQPYLKRPVGQSFASSSRLDHSEQQGQSSVSMATSSHQSTSGGLDAIFTSAPPLPSMTRPVDNVMPMRRGRPTSKPRSTVEAATEGFEAGNVLKHKNSSGKIKSMTAEDVAEESTLFAREAAAGFADAFTVPPPKTGSGTGRLIPTQLEPNSQHASPSIHQSQVAPAIEQKNKRTSTIVASAQKSSLPFDDLVPSTKKPEVLSMNTMRNSRGDWRSTAPVNQSASRPAKRDSFTGPSSTTYPNLRNVSQGLGTHTVRADSISQKTGPQAYIKHANNQTPASQDNFAPKMVSKTLSVLKVSSPLTQGPSLSDWLKKDQVELVSRAVQTSPTLLSCLISELMPTLPPKNMSGPKSSPLYSVPTKPAPINLLADDEDDIAASAKLALGVKSITNGLQSINSKPNNSSGTFNQFRPTPMAKPLMSNDFGAKPSMLSRPLQKKLDSTSSGSIMRKPSQETTSSGSDDGPEDAEGLVKFPGRNTSFAPPLTSKSIPNSSNNIVELSKEKSVFEPQPKSLDRLPEVETSNRSAHVSQPPVAPSMTSNSSMTSSDFTTEEDEEVKARRRAAIAKFAPPATSAPPDEDAVDRDPFSSRAQTRSRSPDNRLSSMVTGSRAGQKPGPPLRAPKPQSLKSAAAITTLVSRYESLSVSDITSPGPLSPVFNATFPNKKVGSVKTSNTGNGQRSSFKPITRTPSLKSPPSNQPIGLAKKRHIPRQSLGPGVSGLPSNSIAEQTERGRCDDEEEEAFNGVHNLKSKWETGAVKGAEMKARAPRTDYGQTR
ncbi:hypothetical protein CROQUDRAFT_140229 [Cronartium quercuum f. sp. fusiforme G11]|uniref:non-specific serine/threonine protein kinase n=1 Tax=Cronartium quercuum f. sp. fusiforme G11 TaxID=708437 RepID=A0A9P6NZQ2_9BASI|nr:hypothetical protein CROQUDRAFT_140229 [Cronartium quercuum f. sp. fusiforme G11]